VPSNRNQTHAQPVRHEPAVCPGDIDVRLLELQIGCVASAIGEDHRHAVKHPHRQPGEHEKERMDDARPAHHEGVGNRK
jgi:hypothetical protein